MSTTLSPPTKLGYGTWQYTWTGTAPFRVFNYQTYAYVLKDSADTAIVVTSTNDIEPPAIEVFDSTETADPQGVTYPAQLVLQWRGYKYAASYRIEKETAPSTYTEVQNYFEDGRGYYVFTAGIQSDDVVEASYRVVTIDKSGEEIDTDSAAYVIRNPSPPLLTYTYSAGTGLLTVAAA
jgi:hypothetical protein